jgi:hypothetical protein
MGFVTRPEAFSISEIKSTAMDKIHMGGTFLQQIPTVTVNGLPVAIRKGAGGSLGSSLGGLVSQVQAAGDIASLVQNPMSAVESAVGNAVSGVSSKLSAATSKLTGGQLSTLTAAVNAVSSNLSNFQAHTSNLSGLSSSISETIPDFSKLTDIGNTLSGLGTDSVSGFLSNTASALTSGNVMEEVKNKLSITVQEKFDQILAQNAATLAGQTAIATFATEINSLLNTQSGLINNIVTTDTHNFNESANNLTASQSVIGLAEQYSNQETVSYALLTELGVAKSTTIDAFNAATGSSG